MRVRISVVIALVSASTPAWAGPASFGIKGGATLATMTQNSAYEALAPLETRTGWTAGGFVLYPLDKAFSLQGDLFYVSRGASLGKSQIVSSSGEPLGSFETVLERDDLDLGVRARFGLAQGAKIQPYLLAGPALSIELDEKMTTDIFGSEPSNLLKSTGVAITFGAGSEIPLGSGHWLLEGNYDLGITDLAEDSVHGTLHASTWRFMTGYHF